MNAEEARKLTKQNEKNNKELQKYIKYTQNEIKQQAKNGKRNAVMYHPYYLEEELKTYWKSKGYQIKRLYPPQLTLYVVW